MGNSVESRWWNSTVSVNFKAQVKALMTVGSQLSSNEWEFAQNMHNLTERNDDMAELGMSEWTPSAKQINYVQALHRQYCVEPLDR